MVRTTSGSSRMAQRSMPSAPRARLEPDDALPGEHEAPEHPVERAAGQELVPALRPHPGDVERARGRAPAARALGDPRRLPVDEVLDAVGADAELEEVDGRGHGIASAWGDATWLPQNSGFRRGLNAQ